MSSSFEPSIRFLDGISQEPVLLSKQFRIPRIQFRSLSTSRSWPCVFLISVFTPFKAKRTGLPILLKKNIMFLRYKPKSIEFIPVIIQSIFIRFLGNIYIETSVSICIVH